MSLAFDPPASLPLPPPADDSSNLWELVYEAMGFHREDDPATSYQLQKLCESLCGPYQSIYDLLREREGQKGWAQLLDPDQCPNRWLFYPAQTVGVEITQEMDEQQIRDEIRHPTSWKRGQTESIQIATRRTLKPVDDEELMVIVRPRTPEVGHHYIRTLLAQTPDPERTEYVVRNAVPAWELLDYEAIEGVTFADITAKFETFGDVAATFPTFKDLAEVLPTEL
jgi:hypothetical protein